MPENLVLYIVHPVIETFKNAVLDSVPNFIALHLEEIMQFEIVRFSIAANLPSVNELLGTIPSSPEFMIQSEITTFLHESGLIPSIWSENVKAGDRHIFTAGKIDCKVCRVAKNKVFYHDVGAIFEREDLDRTLP